MADRAGERTPGRAAWDLAGGRGASSSAPMARPSRTDAAPIFLHTSWRSGGTWLWSRFCALPGAVGLYEPLHEALATLRVDQLAGWRPDGWASGHPANGVPYFESYRPLLRQAGGVRSYPAEYGPQHFFADDDESFPALQRHIEALLEAAGPGVKVLKFCRSIGRLGWMRRHFPAARHVMLMRNPASQWASMRKQERLEQNPYFTAQPWRILRAGQHHPRVALALRAMRVQPDGAGPACSDGERDYRVFLAFWLLNACSAPNDVDAIVNIDLAAASPRYQAEVERTIAGATGLPVSLAGIQTGVTAALEPAWLGITPMEALRCHRDAEDYALAAVQEEDTAVRVAAMLSYAGLLATQGAALLGMVASDQVEDWRQARLIRQELAEAVRQTKRAESRADVAEAHRRAIEESRCWALTAPLRTLGERLKHRPGSPASGNSIALACETL